MDIFCIYLPLWLQTCNFEIKRKLLVILFTVHIQSNLYSDLKKKLMGNCVFCFILCYFIGMIVSVWSYLFKL